MFIEENKPLASFTTFGIGGPARWFASAETEADVAEAAEWAREHAVPLFVLGGGSNLLVADAGFPGLILHVALQGKMPGYDFSRTVLWWRLPFQPLLLLWVWWVALAKGAK